MTMTAVLIGSAVLGAAGKIREGQAQKAQMDAAAQQAEIQGRSQKLQMRQQAIQSRQQSVNVLEKVRRNLSTVNAYASAGGLNPFSGSTGSLMTTNLARGARDFYASMDAVDMATQNMEIAQGAASYQAQIYRSAGKNAQRQGYFNAAASLGQNAYSAYDAGLNPFGGGSSTPTGYNVRPLPGQSYGSYY